MTIFLFDHVKLSILSGRFNGILLSDAQQMKLYLTNSQPKPSDTVKADVLEIPRKHGYTGPMAIHNRVSHRAGAITVYGDPVNVKATGPLRFSHAVIYVPAVRRHSLFGWWELDAPLTLRRGESFSMSFDDDIVFRFK